MPSSLHGTTSLAPKEGTQPKQQPRHPQPESRFPSRGIRIYISRKPPRQSTTRASPPHHRSTHHYQQHHHHYHQRSTRKQQLQQSQQRPQLLHQRNRQQRHWPRTPILHLPQDHRASPKCLQKTLSHTQPHSR